MPSGSGAFEAIDVHCAVISVRDPENRRAIRIFSTGQLVERGADKEEFPIGREHGHRGHTIGPVHRVHRVSLRARRKLAFAVDRHQPEMVGTERVQHIKRATRWGIGQRFCATVLRVFPVGLTSSNVSRPSSPTVKLETELSPPLVANRKRRSGVRITLPAPSKSFGRLVW